MSLSATLDTFRDLQNTISALADSYAARGQPEPAELLVQRVAVDAVVTSGTLPGDADDVYSLAVGVLARARHALLAGAPAAALPPPKTITRAAEAALRERGDAIAAKTRDVLMFSVSDSAAQVVELRKLFEGDGYVAIAEALARNPDLGPALLSSLSASERATLPVEVATVLLPYSRRNMGEWGESRELVAEGRALALAHRVSFAGGTEFSDVVAGLLKGDAAAQVRGISMLSQYCGITANTASTRRNITRETQHLLDALLSDADLNRLPRHVLLALSAFCVAHSVETARIDAALARNAV